MARLRTIKPGFFLDDELAEVQPLGRILYAGLWTIADREGRLEDRPKRIKAETLPYDECDIEVLLDELAAHGFIVRYEVEGQRYIAVPTWAKHQSPHYKEMPSTIPAPDGVTDTYVAVPVNSAQRQRILDRDGHTCRECGATSDLSIDHVVPRTQGGTSDDDNLQTLCRACNASKNNRVHAATEPRSVQRRTDVGSTSPPVVGTSSGNHRETTSLAHRDTAARASSTAATTSFDADFAAWYAGYANKREPSKARDLYRFHRRSGASAEQLLVARDNYLRDCELNDRPVKYPATFLARRNPPWRDWLATAPSVQAGGRRDVLQDLFDQAQAEESSDAQITSGGTARGDLRGLPAAVQT